MLLFTGQSGVEHPGVVGVLINTVSIIYYPAAAVLLLALIVGLVISLYSAIMWSRADATAVRAGSRGGIEFEDAQPLG